MLSVCLSVCLSAYRSSEQYWNHEFTTTQLVDQLRCPPC